MFRFLRSRSQTHRIPIVILSGTLVEDQDRLLALGADGYVAKGPQEDLQRNILATLRRLEQGATGSGGVLGLDALVPHEKVRELLAVRQRTESILEAIGEGVVEIDSRQRVLSVNRAGVELLARPETDLIGIPLTELLSAEHRATLEGAVARFRTSPARSGEGLTLRYRERVLDISFAWAIPGEPDDFFMVMRDITDLTRKIEELSDMNTRLQDMERTRSEFLAMVSHDLHTPLTAIKGSLEVLQHESVGIELSRELLGIAQKNADRLFRMVSDILDLARIEAGRFKTRREPFDVVVSLRGTLDRLRRMAEEKEIGLTLEAPEGLPPVSADGLRMEQVFTNLLGNALKFTPRGGRIRVRVEELPNMLLVEVWDTGVGIPAEHLDRIFDRFYRVPLPAGVEVEGTGLGLSICKAVVEDHGGRIWVESVVGQGSTFSFTIHKSAPAD